jgi:hypothetical protein
MAATGMRGGATTVGAAVGRDRTAQSREASIADFSPANGLSLRTVHG